VITLSDEAKEIKEKEFKKRQEEINQKYEQEGLTDEVLNLQVQLNRDRNEWNISDDTKRIYKNFVQ